MGSKCAWQAAQDLSARCSSNCSRTVVGATPPTFASSSAGMLGGGGMPGLSGMLGSGLDHSDDEPNGSTSKSIKKKKRHKKRK